jgi:hypothetical protein
MLGHVNSHGAARFANCEVDGVGQYSYLVGGTEQDFYNCKSNTSGMLGVATVASGSGGTTIAVNNVTPAYYPSPGILQITQTSTSDVFPVAYTGVTTSGGYIVAFTGCTLGSYAPASGDRVGLLQTAVNGDGTADAWHVTNPSVNIRATIQNDLYGNGIYVASNNCRIDIEAGNAGNALLVLDGASRNMIDMQVSKWTNYIGPPSHVYALSGTNTGNLSRIAGANPGANEDGVSQPVGHIGSEVVISLKQPAAGGATVTWGSAYTVTTSIDTAASARTTWRFTCLSYSSGVPQWDEIG